jgi:hypothetical protein
MSRKSNMLLLLFCILLVVGVIYYFTYHEPKFRNFRNPSNPSNPSNNSSCQNNDDPYCCCKKKVAGNDPDLLNYGNDIISCCGGTADCILSLYEDAYNPDRNRCPKNV